jgi:hypothetical protein
MNSATKTTLILFFTLFSLAFWTPAGAATSGVVGDGTPASCTEAALDTALAEGGDITFNCGDAPHTIVLSEDKNIAIDTVIDGDNRITLSGGNAAGLFTVNGESSLTLRRLTILDTAGAAAVYNSGFLTVEQSTFRNNQRGAVYNAGGVITVANSTFEDNANSQGGAITNENSGTLTVTGSTFTNNRNSGSGNGGAIFSSTGSTATIGDSQFRQNQSPGGGAGAIYNTHVMTIENTIVEDNEAASGGGIYNNGTLLVRNSRISGNEATSIGGGGITHFNQTTTESHLTLVNVTIDNNQSGQGGGGIFFSGELATLEATNITVFNNTANTIGGGGLLVVSGDATLTNATFNANDSVATDGNNIENSNTSPGTITLRNTLVVGGECLGPVVNGGGNLQFPGNSCGADITTGDPGLGELADNGGLTPTHAIAENGPAHDAGLNANCPADDQRGVVRPQTATCDVGAFEWGARPILDSLTPAETLALSPTFTLVVNGSNFIPGPSGSRVLWNGAPLATSYVSGVALHVTIPANLIEAGGTATVTVETPVIDGDVSAASRIFTIVKRDQAITFEQLPDRTPETTTFTVSATADSGLAVTFTATGVCTVADSTVTLTGEAGTCTITAQQAGNQSYNAAADVANSFEVRNQSLVFLPLIESVGQAAGAR